MSEARPCLGLPSYMSRRFLFYVYVVWAGFHVAKTLGLPGVKYPICDFSFVLSTVHPVL